jgi:flavin reductase (DIM6/NTAB) family NADH-FMN oxidoreductase RutF/pimeloyl-ACP methyl ester carboxylesterase
MATVEFKGFAGVRLAADELGAEENPGVLLLHDGFKTRKSWARTADALAAAGRHVLNLDLRGHGESEWPADGRYDLDAFAEDLRAVLRQVGSRPVIVAGSLGGWAAVAALGEEAANLATGLVLADAPTAVSDEVRMRMRERLQRAAERPTATRGWDARVAPAIDIQEATSRIARLAPYLNIPTLVVRGAGSDLSQQKSAQDFVETLPKGEFAEVQRGGEMVGSDPTDEFIGVLLDFLERKAPRQAVEYRAGSDSRTLRDALGCFATGVTIITTTDPTGAPVGLTANSFTSVSLDPELLLVCVAKTATSLDSLLSAEKFAVNILHMGQQPISNRFTRRDSDRFAETPWAWGEHRVPLISNALANFECHRFAEHDGGDHVILVGRVLRACFEDHRDPLLYFRGRYRRLHLS